MQELHDLVRNHSREYQHANPQDQGRCTRKFRHQRRRRIPRCIYVSVNQPRVKESGKNGCYQHQRNFEEVVQSIQEGRECTTNAAEARKAVALIRAVYESAQNDGKKVYL